MSGSLVCGQQPTASPRRRHCVAQIVLPRPRDTALRANERLQWINGEVRRGADRLGAVDGSVLQGLSARLDAVSLRVRSVEDDAVNISVFVSAAIG